MYLSKITRDQYKLAEPIAAALREELLAIIKGKTRQPWRCCCGAISFGAAEAVDVTNSGASYPAQIAGFGTCWSVSMLDETGKRYSCGLTEFISYADLNALFAEAEARRAPGGDLLRADGTIAVELWF